MRVCDVMTKAVVTIHLDDSLQHLLDIFEERRFHHLVVVDDGQPVGVVSDRDLFKHISPFVGNALMERRQDANTLRKRVHQVMSREPVVAHRDMPVAQAARLLLDHRVSCLPVVGADQRICGIVTWRDLLPHCFSCDAA
ncbi:MAG: CBS domain-containing protein [Planctomycetota bacterium]|jgi:acetoin utilization protein AcuB